MFAKEIGLILSNKRDISYDISSLCSQLVQVAYTFMSFPYVAIRKPTNITERSGSGISLVFLYLEHNWL